MKKVFWSFGLSLLMGIMLGANLYGAEIAKISYFATITVKVTALKIPRSVLNKFVSPGKKMITKLISIDADKLVQALKSLQEKNKVSILERIEVITLDEKATTYNRLKDVLYMEKAGKDTFKLKRMTGKDGEGIFFKCTPTLTKDGKIKVDYELIVREIIERMPVEGAEGLDIGSPIFSIKESQSSIVLEEGKPQVANVSGSSDQYFLVILTANKGANNNE